MSTQPPSEEELRAALEEEMKRVGVGDLLLQSVVSLINLGMRRLGLAEGTEDERDLTQVAQAIEAVRALLPTLEHATPQQLPAIRDGLSRLQMAFVQAGGKAAPASEREQPAAQPSRLWVPGQ
jgi:hypothetical protein